MLSAMVGAPTRIRELGSGTEYSGSKRSELLIETTVRASTRVDFSAGRGATADTSAGAAARAGAALPSARGAVDVATTLEPAATSAVAGAVLSGAGTTAAACCTTVCSGRAATTGAGAGTVVAAAGAGAGGVEFVGAVETTTVDDLTSVVVQAPEVVGLDWGAASAGVLEEGAAAACVLDDTFEPAGAAGDSGGAACLAVIVVSRGAVTVVSRRAVPVFDALRTLSVGRAGEADRAVARRTCSIIAE